MISEGAGQDLPQDEVDASVPEHSVRAVRWGLGDAVVGWLLAMFVQFLAIGVAVVATGNGGRSEAWLGDLSMVWIAAFQAPFAAVLLGWPIYISKRKGRGPVLDFGLIVRWRDLVIGLPSGLGAHVAIAVLYIPLLMLLDNPDVSAVARDLTDRANDALGVVLLFVVVGIMAPIAEEVFYRGLVLRALERRMNPAAALWISSLLFGAIHLQPLQFLGQAFLGLVAGWLTQRTGRLGPAIFAHLSFNMITAIALVLA